MKIQLFLIFISSLIATFALIKPGFPPTHDGEYNIVRFYQFDKTLRDGDWYPRWQPDLNYGYGSPLLNYYYPLPNYAASLLHFLGFSFIGSFKIQMIAATILGAFFMYLWTRQFWGEWGGVVGAFFYTYSPYHFLDIIIRGSVGEVWALAFFPAFLWSATKFVKEKKNIFLSISAAFLALIIFSHNILALMFFPFALFYIVFIILDREQSSQKRKFKKYLILNTFYLILLALGFSAIFWLPAIFERGYVRGLEIFDYKQHFVEIYQLIFPSWGSGFSSDPQTEGLSFQIGIANLLALSVSTFLTFYLWKKRKVILKINVFILICILLTIFLTLRLSQPFWEMLPLLRYFQFPWRLLSLVILFCSFLAGSIVFLYPRKIIQKVILFLLITLTFIFGIGYAKPAYYHQRDDSYYFTRPNFMDGTNVPGNSFNTIWFNPQLAREKEKIKFIKGRGSIETYSIKATNYKFVISAGQDSEILVNTAYFPGWTAFINGEKKQVLPNKDGLIVFDVKEGAWVVEIRLLDTAIRSLGRNITLVSFLILFLLFAVSVRARIRI